MYQMLIAMPVAAAFILIIFVFRKRAVLFSSSARQREPIPQKKMAQDLSMRKLVAYLIPQEKQTEINRIFSDYGSKTYLEFKRAYRELLDDVELEEADFSQDIRGSLLVMWMKQEKMLYLWESETDNEAVRSFLEEKTGVLLSGPEKKKEILKKRWAEEMRQHGYTIIVLRDSFEGDPILAVPCSAAQQIAEKRVSDILVTEI